MALPLSKQASRIPGQMDRSGQLRLVSISSSQENPMCRRANRPALGGTVPLFYQMSRVPLNHGNVPLFVRSRIFYLRARNL